MKNVKYKVSDRVKIKSLDWYNKNKNRLGNINYGCETEILFTSEMSSLCGQVGTITRVRYVGNVRVYHLAEDDEIHLWVAGMFEGLMEEEKNSFTETLVDTVKESEDRHRIVIDPRFDIEVDEGEYYIVRRKKAYPKTYEECAKELGYNQVMPKDHILGYKGTLLSTFQQLLICRDAYWKIAGDEMGLGKPWKPDWKNGNQKKYCIYNDKGNIQKGAWHFANTILSFPTPKMHDAFKENFDPDIEFCKEFL